MPTKPKPRRRLTRALLETVDDMRRSGVLAPATHNKITMRHQTGVDDPTTIRLKRTEAIR